jgi:antitoxin HicB
MKAREFLRRVQELARARDLSFHYDAGLGKGSHGRVILGLRQATIKDLRKELGEGLLKHYVQTARDRETRPFLRGNMVTLTYPAILRPEAKGRGYVVSFADLPEALTGGRSLPESLREAADCLGSALSFRMLDRAEIPLPSKIRKGQTPVQVPFSVAPKVALYMAMRQLGISNAELARRLGCRETAVRRMLDPKHASRPESLQDALAMLGKRITLRLDDAA